MQKVQRSDIIDYQSYNDIRGNLRAQVMAEKAARRIHLGDHLTFLFETATTIRYQIQEMMRLEQIVREKDIQHEIDTYNQLLGDEGELGCSLLIEIDDEQRRNRFLREWLGLPEHIYLRAADGTKIPARWDQAQVGTDRLSSVQYLKFAVGNLRPVAIGVDHPHLTCEAQLTKEQQDALEQDLRGESNSTLP